MRGFLSVSVAEYPLQVMPQFTQVDLPTPNLGFEDSSLLEDFDEEPQGIHDVRPTIEVVRTYYLCWRDISLYYFLPEFISMEVMDVRWLTHIDLSHNCLVSLPTKIFKLPHLESLNISHNQLTSLPRLEAWHQASKLQVLNASHNQIVVSNQNTFTHGGKEQFHDLWYLDLSDNMLTSFPMFVFCFHRILYLDISRNSQVRKTIYTKAVRITVYMYITDNKVTYRVGSPKESGYSGIKWIKLVSPSTVCD